MRRTPFSRSVGNRFSCGVVVVLFALHAGASAGFADATLEIRVTDGREKLLPCRIHLADAAGEPVRAKGLPFWRDHFVCTGNVSLPLSAGEYTVTIERGHEYQRVSRALTLGKSEHKTFTTVLERIAEFASKGWYSGDLHVHRPVEEVPLLMQAEDLHVAPVITWWNNRNRWAGESLPQKTLNRFDGNRYFDVMAGEDEREGGALMYFHLKRPLAIDKSQREYPSPMRFVAQAREFPQTWIDIEKPFWWDVPIWLASGEIDSIGIANNHMCRSRMYEDEAWGKPRDAKRLPAPRGNGFWTQEIYYDLLNSGLRVPPSAGSASGVLPNPVGYNRVYVHTGKNLDYDAWWAGLRAGRSFVTNGPLLLTVADGQRPGHIFSSPDGRPITISIQATVVSNDSIPQLEIIKNGATAHAVDVAGRTFEGDAGRVTFNESGWFLVRAITDEPRTFRFASTAPYYVEIGDDARRVSERSVRFFLNWSHERKKRVPRLLKDAGQLAEVLVEHDHAIAFWSEQLEKANAP